MNKQLSLEIKNLEKEILEKQLKKMDSKYIVQYIECFIHLDYLFLGSSVKTEEIEILYYGSQNKGRKESEILEKSRRPSPKKRQSTENSVALSQKDDLFIDDQVFYQYFFQNNYVLLIYY